MIRLVVLIVVLLCSPLVVAADVVTSSDLARRFGVAESSLTQAKSQWKIECSESSQDFFERFRDLEEISNFLRQDLTKLL